MILDEMDDGVDATVQGSVVRTVGGAEILTPGQLAVARHVQGVLDELGYPLALCSGASTMGRSSSMSCKVR